MNRYVIAINEHAKESRDYVASQGEGTQVIKWYDNKDPEARKFRSKGMPFGKPPCLVDTHRRLHINLAPTETVAEGIERLKGRSQATIKETVKKYIDSKSRHFFLRGFKHDSKRFPLSPTDQLNYQHYFTVADNLTYPIEIPKMDGAMYSVATAAILKTICKKASGRAIKIIEGGWALKKTLEGKTYEELKAFEDDRVEE